jgi:hypothetical protein
MFWERTRVTNACESVFACSWCRRIPGRHEAGLRTCCYWLSLLPPDVSKAWESRSVHDNLEQLSTVSATITLPLSAHALEMPETDTPRDS